MEPKIATIIELGVLAKFEKIALPVMALPVIPGPFGVDAGFCADAGVVGTFVSIGEVGCFSGAVSVGLVAFLGWMPNRVFSKREKFIKESYK